MAETMNVWDKFDSEIDIEGLKADVADAAANGGNGNYKEVPHGSYEVKVEKIELTASKQTKKPMVTVWFKIVNDCAYKNSLIFMNQVVSEGFQIHIVNELLRSMDTGIDIQFSSYRQYGNMLMDVKEALDATKLEFALEYNKNSKGYNTFEITDIFEPEE